MIQCFFVSDLHGRTRRFERLFDVVARERPRAVFIGGDFLPSGGSEIPTNARPGGDFIRDFLVERFLGLRGALGAAYPRVFIIMGNDDMRSKEAPIIEAEASGVWEYAHFRTLALDRFEIRGYSYVPPTPFLLKDWERYDVSRYVDPGAISPEEGRRTVPEGRPRPAGTRYRQHRGTPLYRGAPAAPDAPRARPRIGQAYRALVGPSGTGPHVLGRPRRPGARARPLRSRRSRFGDPRAALRWHDRGALLTHGG